MKDNKITIRHSLLICKPVEIVWDYTQNYDNRPLWDSSILKAEVKETEPARVVKLKMKWNTSMTFVYKLDEKPNATTLAAIDISSFIISAAGGSWRYEKHEGNTLWTQNNTILLRNNLAFRFLAPLYKLMLTIQTKNSMRKAKKNIEKL